MGRVRFSDVEHYGGSGSGGNYFSLKDDGDVARVRFMIDGEEGLDDITYAIHRTEIGGKYRPVNCLREYNEPVSKCPFCEEFANVQARFFIPLYNVDADEVQIWERGKTFAAQLSSIISRYGTGKKGPLVSHIFEIERHGKAKDMQTTYAVFEVEQDDTKMEDLPEVPEMLGNVFILDKTADDMNYFIDANEFPPEDDESVRRRNSRGDDAMNPPEDDELPFEEKERESRRSTRETRTDNNRRTPSNSGGRRRNF